MNVLNKSLVTVHVEVGCYNIFPGKSKNFPNHEQLTLTSEKGMGYIKVYRNHGEFIIQNNESGLKASLGDNETIIIN